MTHFAVDGQRQRRGRAHGMRRMLFGNRKRRPCHYCLAPLTLDTATIDHVVPLSKGGYDRIQNCVLACRACNSAKGSHLPGQRKYWQPTAESSKS